MSVFKQIDISLDEQDAIWKQLSESSQKSIKEKYEEVYKISLLDFEFKPQVKILESIFGKHNLR